MHCSSRGRCGLVAHTGGRGRSSEHTQQEAGRDRWQTYTEEWWGEIVDVHSREKASEREIQQMHTAGGRNA